MPPRVIEVSFSLLFLLRSLNKLSDGLLRSFGNQFLRVLLVDLYKTIQLSMASLFDYFKLQSA